MEQLNNQGEKIWSGKTFGAGKALKVATIVLSVFLLAETVSVLKSLNYIGADPAYRNTISVSGTGEVFAVPDVAEISFTVTENAKTGAEAQSKATDKMNSILAALRRAGVADKDVKTVGYNIYPKYEYVRSGDVCYQNGNYVCPPYGKEVITGYEVSHSILVKVRKVDDAGSILATIGGYKVSNVSGINFTIDDEEVLRTQARDKAITNAKSKAETLARSLGVSLGKLVSFGESGGMPGPIYYGKAMMLGMGGDVAPAPTPELPTGENKITSNVTLTYEIR